LGSYHNYHPTVLIAHPLLTTINHRIQYIQYIPKHQKCIPPTNNFLTGTWHVTHTSLPSEKDKLNVKITYRPLPPSPSGIAQLDDLVQYQGINSSKIKPMRGIDMPMPGAPGAWDWCGNGWLVIASSHWECLGCGRADDGNERVMTYFAKTVFTSAGIDLYSRRREGLEGVVVDGILGTSRGLSIEEIGRLVEGDFEVPRD
jgi:hypothetical protein